MIRRLEVTYGDNGAAPEIKFEGIWSRHNLDSLHIILLKSLKVYKAELIKNGNKKLIKAKK